MSLKDLKIKDSEINTYGVTAAPDKLTGTAQENKEVFDRLIRECVGGKFNALIDYIHGREEGENCALPIASADVLGAVKIGEGLAIDEEGLLSVSGLADVEAALDVINGEVV